jgi:hypothetical protein
MARPICAFAALCLFSSLSLAAADDTSATQADRACSGVTNEVTKGKALNRELNAYAGQTVPDELQQRVLKHLTQVAKAKAECEAGKDQAAQKK